MEDADESKALDDVKNRVDSIDTFPEETEKPIINIVERSRNVLDIAITGPQDERALKELAQQVRDDIVALPEVTQASVSNTRPYEMSIEVSEASLRRHKLSFDQVAAAVRSGSLDLPGGSIKPRRVRYCYAPRARHIPAGILRTSWSQPAQTAPAST